jgi:hypothetical protein
MLVSVKILSYLLAIISRYCMAELQQINLVAKRPTGGIEDMAHSQYPCFPPLSTPLSSHLYPLSHYRCFSRL